MYPVRRRYVTTDELTKQGLESGGDVSSEAKIDAENEGDADNNW